MRTLLILRGAPGAGKSTWVKNNGLEPYTLCPDTLRVMLASRELQADGHFAIARNKETEQNTWKIIFELLEYRMARGELTVLDATASKTKDIQQYRDLAEKYRYRTYIIDFTDVPLETCLAQNKMRPEDKWVPEESIKNIYARFATQPVPSRIDILKPNELDKILEKPIDLSFYKKIVFVGDIHGCYDTLMQYPDFKNGLKDNTCYIFLGDYVDRGNQNAEVMKFMQSIMNKPNVCILEGNHERWLRDYGDGIQAKSNEFEYKTKPQLIAAGYTQKDARMFYRKVRQMSHFTFYGIEVLACHAGIPYPEVNLMYLPTEAFVHGVGTYGEYQVIAENWMSKSKEDQYLVHGHRNTKSDPVQIADRVFNLEGKVEFGGKLRIVELTGNTYPGWAFGHPEVMQVNGTSWNVIELDDCQPIDENLKTEERKVETVEEAVAYLRHNKFINEKKLGNDISSFNFSREAFYKANWTRQTVLARGLFIDTKNNKIMARSYEKFFRINETPETSLAELKNKLHFPVKAYVKENGFLAIVSYDYNKDDLFIASKSTNTGDYVGYIKKLLEPYREKILNYLRAQYLLKVVVTEAGEQENIPVSLVFECIDQENDPHIIKYNKNDIYLLDVIFNKLNFEAFDYEHLKMLADVIGCPVKEEAFELKDYDALVDLYTQAQDEDYKYNGNYIEGFVFVDSAGFMTKLKTGYYNFWKFMRSVADQTLRAGYYARTGALQTAQANYFYGFCRELYKNDRDIETKEYPYKTDIITLREKYYQEFHK